MRTGESVRFVRPGDDLEGRGHAAELLVGEQAGEVLADAPQVGPCGSSRASAAGIGQRGMHDPVVAGAAVARDQLPFDQSIHDSGKTARREHRALCEFGHLQSPVRRARESDKHVVVAQADVVRVTQLEVQLLGYLLMRMEQCLPGC